MIALILWLVIIGGVGYFVGRVNGYNAGWGDARVTFVAGNAPMPSTVPVAKAAPVTIKATAKTVKTAPTHRRVAVAAKPAKKTAKRSK